MTAWYLYHAIEQNVKIQILHVPKSGPGLYTWTL